MSLTSTEAQAQLDEWSAASLAVAKNQSYAIGDRTLTRVNAAWIENMISYWAGVVRRLKAEEAGAPNPDIKVATWSE